MKRVVMGTERISPERLNEQVERIIRSSIFRNASTLQRLLRYVSSKALNGSAQELKEYTIGVEALGRRPDYDTTTDTIVRVQIHRLRQKLTEYYEGDGLHDPIVIEIPKGHYVPTVEPRKSLASSEFASEISNEPQEIEAHDRAVETQPELDLNTESIAPHGLFSPVRKIRFFALAAGAIAFLFVGFLIGTQWAKTKSTPLTSPSNLGAAHSNQAVPLDDDVRTYWSRFIGSDYAPIIAYPDAIFLLDETNDLFRFRRGASDNRGSPVDPHLAQQFASNPALVAKAGPLFYENGYTGTGEVESVALLIRLFTEMGVYPRLKRGSEITTDDLKHHNIILLGSSFQNSAVAQLPLAGNFIFENPDPRQELWRGRIRNQHPKNGETVLYGTERDPVTQAVKTDHSLISLQPGIVPGRYVTILGGLDTTGTEGAALFVTSGRGIEALTKWLTSTGGNSGKDQPFLFQAIIKVDVQRGEDVLDTHLITADVLRPLK